jgi:carbon storage regulator CsrA
MLILSRRPNESLRIAGNVIITVVGFNGNQIRLGITAPPDVVIDREEVHQRKVAEGETNISPVALPAVPQTRTPTVRRRPEVRRRSRLQAE